MTRASAISRLLPAVFAAAFAVNAHAFPADMSMDMMQAHQGMNPLELVATQTPEPPKFDLEQVKEQAAKGVPSAQFALGEAYETGTGGLKKDAAQAVHYYELAAKNGNTMAMTNLAACYMDGRGVAQNLVKAAELLESAAMKGDIYAAFNLSNAYFEGYGVKQDLGLAFSYALEAAQGGLLDAQTLVGYFYLQGIGTKPNAEQALVWFKKAAERGDGEASEYVGAFHENGIATKADAAEALKWYKKACDAGRKSACTSVERVEAALKAAPGTPTAGTDADGQAIKKEPAGK